MGVSGLRFGFGASRASALLVAALLSGCTSFSGAQDPISAADLGHSVCPTDADVAKFESLPLAERAAFRDDVISGCIDAIDGKYGQFKVALQRDTVSLNVATDLLSLGLTTAASMTNGSGAKYLAAGGAAVIGAGAAINKDVYYQQTLPAIESAMDANRDQIHIRIVKSQAADPEAKTYTLSSARSDIFDYQAAGNLYVGISQLTSTSKQTSDNVKDDLQQAKIAYVSQVLDVSVATREKVLTDDVRKYEKDKNSAMLTKIAAALAVPANPNLVTQRKLIIQAIDKRVSEASVSDPKKAMDDLSKLLAPITGKAY